MSTGRRVVIHIDELVLRGFRPEDRHAIAEGLQDPPFSRLDIISCRNLLIYFSIPSRSFINLLSFICSFVTYSPL